jgi:hypothetical protein
MPATTDSGPLPVATQSLTETIAAQRATVERLSRELEFHKQDQQLSFREMSWRIDRYVWLIGIVVTFAAFFGFRTWADLEARIRTSIRATLEKELYQLDPTMLTIRLRRNRDLDRELVRLRSSGLKNTQWYSDFGKICKTGITIVPIGGSSDEEEFVSFLRAIDIDPSSAAFILYSPSRYRISDSTLNAFDNLAVANMPTTLASAVLVVGRGLNMSEPARSADKTDL